MVFGERTTMDFLQLMQERYTTKHYDSTKIVPQDLIDKILECTRLTPTSVNGQPYHFYVASGEAKAKLRPAIKDFNLERFDGASHVVIVSALTKLNESQLEDVLNAEIADGRIRTEEISKERGEFRFNAEKMHEDMGDFQSWSGKQAYIALGTMLYAAHSYGVDSTAIGGIFKSKIDELLDLEAKGESCQFVVLLGYRAANDSNTIDKRPKSRLPSDKLITVL